jgi:hypothetical protein
MLYCVFGILIPVLVSPWVVSVVLTEYTKYIKSKHTRNIFMVYGSSTALPEEHSLS